MSINALSTATAGLQAMQTAIGVVSQNVANAGTAGYVKRTVTTVSNGAANSGVAVGSISRTFDDAALKQLRLETSGAAYTSTKADILAQIDKLYGTPGDSTALDATLNTFTQALQGLASNPTLASARTTVVNAATILTTQIGSIASSVQDLRTGAESRLSTETSEANGLLASIANLNLKASSTSDDSVRAGILDQRDQQITQLSSYLDIKTVNQTDGTVSVLTNSGVTLVDRGNATTLSFDGRGTLSAESAYSSDPGKRSVGTITATLPGGGTIDLGASGALRSGSIAAEIELRDMVLPQAQRQLDDLAAGLAASLSDKTVAGTPSGSDFALNISDLQNLKPGNTITIPVGSGAAVRNIILVASKNAGGPVDPSQTVDSNATAQTFQIPSPLTAASLATALNGALTAASARLPTGYSAPTVAADATTGALTFSGGNLKGVSAGITVPASASALTGAYPQIPFFTDGSGNTLITGSLDGSVQRTGLAQRISVNALLKNDSSSLVANATTSSPNGERPQLLYDALTSTKQTFSSASGIGGINAPHSASVVGFAQEIISAQGAAATSAQSLDEGQSVALATAQGRFATSAGVNIDEEMSRLIELQTAYTANARVLTAARDMLDTLLRI
ncbi:flagellar hook-associated protein FlgK [Methylobacterium planeticum]|uniref:Flagellar hook-associated protein 1 n=1 Tax=Methylobacterium planeticum TaxID=2615211 RepID=A0A6N6MVP5_9HYPH|nr:flagellar hook-associated protein FlgK [Methylobacterium planeticum]KAB1073869.1 flagellar hook-associated protein FlgK [Methylobacterium planeticum]